MVSILFCYHQIDKTLQFWHCKIFSLRVVLSDTWRSRRETRLSFRYDHLQLNESKDEDIYPPCHIVLELETFDMRWRVSELRAESSAHRAGESRRLTENDRDWAPIPNLVWLQVASTPVRILVGYLLFCFTSLSLNLLCLRVEAQTQSMAEHGDGNIKVVVRCRPLNSRGSSHSLVYSLRVPNISPLLL